MFLLVSQANFFLNKTNSKFPWFNASTGVSRIKFIENRLKDKQTSSIPSSAIPCRKNFANRFALFFRHVFNSGSLRAHLDR